MNWYKRLALAKQLVSAFLAVAMIAVAIGLAGLAQTQKVALMLQDMHDNQLLPIQQLNAGVGQINAAISQISQAVAQNAAASEELASTSQEVSAQAMELQSTMGFFQLAAAPHRQAASKGAFQERMVGKAARATRFEDSAFTHF